MRKYESKSIALLYKRHCPVPQNFIRHNFFLHLHKYAGRIRSFGSNAACQGCLAEIKGHYQYLKASESRSQKAQSGEKDPETQTGVGENYKKKFKAAGPN